MNNDIKNFKMFDEQPAVSNQPSQIKIFMGRTKHKTVYTTSLSLAEFTGTAHKNILASIRRIISSDTTNEASKCFYETTYKNQQNKELVEYYINQNGFLLLSSSSKAFTQEDKTRIMMIYSAHNENNRTELNNALEENKRLKEQLDILNMDLSTPEGKQQFMANAVLVANDVIAEQKAIIQNQQQAIEDKEQEIKDMTPDAEFGKSLRTSTNNILVRQLANRIVTALKNEGFDASFIGEKNLFAWLRDNGFLIRSNKSRDYNNPTKRSLSMEIMACKLTTIEHKTIEGTWTNGTPEITPKGVEYFINKFKNIYREGGTILDGIKDKK